MSESNGENESLLGRSASLTQAGSTGGTTTLRSRAGTWAVRGSWAPKAGLGPRVPAHGSPAAQSPAAPVSSCSAGALGQRPLFTPHVSPRPPARPRRQIPLVRGVTEVVITVESD